MTEDRVVACFVDEFECPGGERKKAFVAKLKLDRDCKMEMTKYRNKLKVDTSLAVSFRFENFAANCQHGEALGKVEKLFHGIKQVKLGKLRPSDKISADKCQYLSIPAGTKFLSFVVSENSLYSKFLIVLLFSEIVY